MGVNQALSHKQVLEIQERADKATPGPWTADCEYLIGNVPKGRPSGENIAMFVEYPRHEKAPAKENCEFTAHARTDVPALTRQLDQAMEALSELHSGYGNECANCATGQKCPASDLLHAYYGDEGGSTK